MDLKESLKVLIKKWDEEAAAWRIAGKLANDDKMVSTRNYARANILESCVETLEELIERHEES